MAEWRRMLSLALVIVVAASSVSTFGRTAEAVTASDWRAGNIIGDSVFTNKSEMDPGQIQRWLDAKLQNCDYWGTQPSEWGGPDYNGDGTTTRAEYGTSRGNPAPFTCLNNYFEVPKTAPGSAVPASNYGTSTIPSGAKSAARLIYEAAQAYNINPKVLLVKLGTESAGPLTSDTWPFKNQYLYAMGAHCPDSGPGGSANCDSNYAGFSLQMREAAKLLRWYLDNMTEPWWSYKKPYTTNYVLWNVVERGCGGKNVYITNKATAALYTYTPYQPNAAALANMYGTGDNCSAYGNRNFWRVYSDWFGSTQKISFESMSRPRWLTVPADMRKIDLSTGLETGATIPAGTEVFFSDKIWLYDEPILRTRHDADNKIHRGIPLSQLEEVVVTFEPMNIPRWLDVKTKNKKIDPVTEETSGSSLPADLSVYFTEKYSIGGNVYLRSRHDSSAGAQRAVLFSNLRPSDVAVKPMNIPRWFTAPEDTIPINLATAEVSPNTTVAGTKDKYTHKIVLNGKVFLRLNDSTASDDFYGIPIESLSELPETFVDMLKPRIMKVASETTKIDASSKEIIGAPFSIGREISFSGKIYIDGELYLRTTHDSERGYNRAILFADLEDV